MKPQRKPNFVFILTDDQGWGDAQVFGHPYLKTPNLDNLAAQGTWFKQFYVSSPVCSPSRCSFLTSHFPARHEIHGHLATHELNAARHMPDWLDSEVTTLPDLLKQAGYTTAHFGKWHLGRGPGAPLLREYGFDFSKAHNANGPQLGDAYVREYSEQHGTVKSTDSMDVEKLPYWRANSTRLIVDETLRFIQANQDRPFYVNVWTLLPHAPLHPTAKQLAVYKDLQPRADDPAFGDWMKEYLANATDLKSQMQVFAASLTDLDEQVGRLLKGIEELGLADDTVVVFSSDNGPEDYRIGNAANAGVGSTGILRARKRSLYEGGVRTSCLVRWPGKVPKARVDDDSVLAAVDLLPTLCALADVPVSDKIQPDGEDVSDILFGKSRPRHKPIFWEWLFKVWGHEYVAPMLVIRDGRWKLLLNPDHTRLELYDIPNDPEERTNLAEQHPELVERLSQKALVWQKTLPSTPDRDGWSKPIPR